MDAVGKVLPDHGVLLMHLLTMPPYVNIALENFARAKGGGGFILEPLTFMIVHLKGFW